MPETPPETHRTATARPSLTERRKAATQLEIARTAAALFAERGADSTTAEDIARASGIALRTFYRYFRTKEDAVAPLLSSGVKQWIADLRDSPGELPVPRALERAALRALTPTDEAETQALHWTRGLIRAMDAHPGLRSVWLRVTHDAEEELTPVLAALAGDEVDPLEIRLASAAANTAMRVAVEVWATTDAPDHGPGGPAELAARCVHGLTAGLRLWDGPGATPAG
ncbi:TetR family transcriptional regulator [Streptomyces sp. NBC_01089]|uniref:TetR family transcriptional regulator n=1 Tax=Streptomyces sp. NBC_01089 TaxID=2903747 RepID=UPI00387039D4|nr:TetR/AcrR family transcriptional regulator [Streptomyces sp. NBC_01089]